MTDTDIGAHAGDIFAKAFTLGYETGRKYIPEGGMPLTAEQVAAVQVLHNDVRLAPEFGEYRRLQVREAQRKLDALFPATEPAERIDHGSVDDGMGSEWQRCKADCGIEIVRPGKAQCDFTEPTDEDDPAPAVPAEEETKAEVCGKRHPSLGAVCTLKSDHSNYHHDRSCGYSWPASSPVVPAPTEAEQTIDREDRAELRKLADAVVSASGLAHGILGMLDGMDDNDEIHAAPAETGPRPDVPKVEYRGNADQKMADLCGGKLIAMGEGFWKIEVPTPDGVTYVMPGDWIAVPNLSGPWQSLNDVPTTVRKVKAANGYEWVRRVDNSEWLGCDTGNIICHGGHSGAAPFVAAPTENGPWQTWQEVPEGVPFKSHNGMDVVWRREGALVWFKHFRQDARDLNDLAPFVAAEEKDA